MKLDARPPSSRARSAGAVLLVVVVAALAVATLLRPRAGYATAQPLLLALLLGAGLGLAALLIAGLLGRIVLADRAGTRSLRRAATAWPSVAIILAVFITAAAAPRVVHGIVALTRDQGASRAAEQADFRNWQQIVVPIVVSYSSALKKDAAFGHGLPRRHLRGLLGALTSAQARLEDLRRRAASSSPALRSRPELARLTASLERSLGLAVRAQGTLCLAVRIALRPVGATVAARARLKRLVTLGVRQLQSSQAAMYAFSLEANKLGASLFVSVP